MDSSFDNKYIISEFLTIDPDVKKINEAIEKGAPIIVPCILQKANTLNRNGRVYPSDILKREVAKYMELVKERTAMGELDHPDSAVISLTNVSHLVTEMWWDGEVLHGKIQIVDTPAGDTVKGLLKSAELLGINGYIAQGIGSNTNYFLVLDEEYDLLSKKYPDETVPRPPHWGGYILKPSTIEFWQGRPSRLHDRILFVQENNKWKIQRLAP